MLITSTQEQGHILVTVLQLTDKLDGSNYMQLVDEARKSYLNGMRDLLIDLSHLAYPSSAGITAIHNTALMFHGMPLAEEKSGWASYHAIGRDRGSGVQKHVRLLSPQPEAANILDISGFTTLFEIHTDLDAALAYF